MTAAKPQAVGEKSWVSVGASPSSAHVGSPATVHHPLLSARYPSHGASNPIAQPQLAGHSKRAPRHVPRVCCLHQHCRVQLVARREHVGVWQSGHPRVLAHTRPARPLSAAASEPHPTQPTVLVLWRRGAHARYVTLPRWGGSGPTALGERDLAVARRGGRARWLEEACETC